jgi:hypothetical protein
MSESDRGIVVSRRRFAQMARAVGAAPEAPTVPAPKSHVAVLVGAQHVEQAVGAEPEVPELSDVEKASMVMRFNAAKQMLEDADIHPGVLSTVENQLSVVSRQVVAVHCSGSFMFRNDSVPGAVLGAFIQANL